MHRLSRVCLARPRLTLCALGAATAFLAAGALRLRADGGFRGSIGRKHPSVVALDTFLERFGGGMPVAALWTCDGAAPCDRVIDPESLRMAYRVSRALERVEGVRSVTSPATAPLLVPHADGLDVRRLVVEGEPTADVEALWKRALDDPLWVRQVISEDGSVAAIVLDLASSEAASNLRALEALQRELEPYEDAGFEFRLLGDPVVLHLATAELQRDTMRILPAVAVLIVAVIALLFRSWRAAIAALIPAGIAVGWSVGLMGWLAWPETALTNALMAFVLVIGVCNAIHIVSRYSIERVRSASPSGSDATFLRVARDVGGACAVASATTAGGFASFATSGALSVVHFGLVAAFGVLSSLVLSFALLPLLLRWLPVESAGVSAASQLWSEALGTAVDAVRRRSGLILVASAALVAVFGAGIQLVRVDVDIYHLFGEHSPVVRWVRFAEQNFRKPDTLEVALHLPAGRDVERPEVLETIGRVAASLEGAAGLGRATSVLEPLSRLNRVVHADDPAFERPADTAAGNAELLLLLSLHDPSLLDRWLSLDREVVRVSVEADVGSKTVTSDVLDGVRRYLDGDLPDGWSAEVTGPVEVAIRMFEEVQHTQISSFSTALLVVLVLVAVFLRSLPWALVAMIPTLVPVVVTLGWMGFAEIYLDMGTALVAAIVLGIGIDDSVHLLTQYRRRRAAGAAPEAALREACIHSGRAVVTTSVALSLGFCVLALSSWASVANFGLLTAVAILGAMLADLLVLPALIVAGTRLPRRSAAEDPA